MCLWLVAAVRPWVASATTPADWADRPLFGGDVILLIDLSGSMRFTDPNRMVLSAVADFIDWLPIEYSRVGIIGFTGELRHVIELTPLTSESVQADLRAQLAAFEYRGFTDIGLALLTAAEMMLAQDELRNPMILLATDGFIEIGPANPGRTVAQSRADVDMALGMLQQQRIPVYTVGMHNPSGVDVELVHLMARASGGVPFFTDDAGAQLSGVLADIFMTHMVEFSNELPTEESPTASPEEVIVMNDPANGTVIEDPPQEDNPPTDMTQDDILGEDTAPNSIMGEPLPEATGLSRGMRGLLYTLAIGMAFVAVVSVIQLLRKLL